MKSVNSVNVLAGKQVNQQTSLAYATIIDQQGDYFLLDSDQLAKVADGLGVQLECGDLVTYVNTQHGAFIVALLQAVARKKIYFGFNCAEEMMISAEQLELVGRRSLNLRSLRELSIESCRKLSLRCRDLLQTASGNVIAVMSNWIHHCDQGSVETKGVLRSNAGSQIVTAKDDLRLDAKRINMG